MEMAVALLAVLYLLVIVQYQRTKSQFIRPVDLAIGMAMWPLLLLSICLDGEIIASYLSILSYASITLIPLILALQYNVVTAQVLQQPVNNHKIWLHAIVVLLSCSSLVAVPEGSLQMWLRQPPPGQLLVSWPFYLIHLSAGFAVLMLGVVISEHIQRYHHYLNDQVVDPGEYRLKKVKHGYGFVVMCSLISICVVLVNAFDILPIHHWSLLNLTVLTAAVLVSMLVVVLPHQSSPSPIDYNALENKAYSRAMLQKTLEKTHEAILQHKLYKQVGLTLSKVAELAKVEPTTLAKATRELNQQKFRRYIYEYRLDYAKKVLLRSDTKIADVAQKLGLNSKKFLNEVLVEHLHKFKS